ncbi:MAG: hypothetical protein O6763_05090 [Gammaproteobacteria bacterium]|nr:hypothetical protein [Gammaproteobacteria bacterium]
MSQTAIDHITVWRIISAFHQWPRSGIMRDRLRNLADTMTQVSNPHMVVAGDAAPVPGRHLGIALAAVLICGLAGFAYGDAVIDGMVLIWSGWIIPSFTQMYLLGIALCT